MPRSALRLGHPAGCELRRLVGSAQHGVDLHRGEGGDTSSVHIVFTPAPHIPTRAPGIDIARVT